MNQASGLGSFLAKLPKDAVWVTSPLTRAMETCVHGYKSSLDARAAQKRKGAAVREAAGGGGGGEYGNANQGDKVGGGGGGGGGGGQLPRAWSRLSNGKGHCRSRSDENGVGNSEGAGTPVAATTPGYYHPAEVPDSNGRYSNGHSDSLGESSGGRGQGAGVGQGAGPGPGPGAGPGLSGQLPTDAETPTPAAARPASLASCARELGDAAVGASPSQSAALDGAEMAVWGDRVVVHPHLSEKLSTSGDIGRCKVGCCTFTPPSPHLHPTFIPGSSQVHLKFKPGSP